MIDPPIHDLGMTDTSDAQLVSKGYESLKCEHQLIPLGEDPDTARKLYQFVGLLQDKPPQTESEWEELMAAPIDACRYRPDFGQRRGQLKAIESQVLLV